MLLLDGIIKLFGEITSLCNKAMDASDPEKYANSVEKLTHSVDATYERMKDIVINDSTLTADEKLERLDKIASSQASARQSCEEAIKGNRKNVSKITGEVLLAFTTCGISFAPKLFKKKGKSSNDVEVKSVSAEEPTNLIAKKSES